MPELTWTSIGREGTYVECPSCGVLSHPHELLETGCIQCGETQQSITLTAEDDTDA